MPAPFSFSAISVRVEEQISHLSVGSGYQTRIWLPKGKELGSGLQAAHSPVLETRGAVGCHGMGLLAWLCLCAVPRAVSPWTPHSAAFIHTPMLQPASPQPAWALRTRPSGRMALSPNLLYLPSSSPANWGMPSELPSHPARRAGLQVLPGCRSAGSSRTARRERSRGSSCTARL